VVAPDAILEIAPIAPAEAVAYLQTLVAAYVQGIHTPLPIACKTAFVWLNTPDKAPASYQGDEWNNGEVDYDAHLRRFFPRFASVYQMDDGKNFDYWAERLYRPLSQHLRQQKMAQDAA
jgi:exodeoxyribonuclease V gamma subunit